MRILVLGGGAQGAAAAWDLLRTSGVDEVVVADRPGVELPPFLMPRVGNGLRVEAVDARDPASVRSVLEGMDCVACALPFHFNLEMARLAVEAGVHFADLGGNTAIVQAQRELDPQARERGLSVIPDCGLAPGLVNILAQAGIDALDRTDAVRMWVGGLPEHPEPPLNYQIVYSLEGVLDYYTTPGLVLVDGEVREVESLTGLQTLEFPEPVGTLEAFYTAGGISTMPHRYRGRIRTMEYRSLRYPGHATLMRGIRDLGLLDPVPVAVNGAEISPRQFFIDRVTPRLRKPGSPDLAILRVEARGERGGQAAGLRFDLLDRWDPQTGISAMMRVTGFSLALTAVMQGRGEIRFGGVRTPDEAVDPKAFVDGLAERGIRVEQEEWMG